MARPINDMIRAALDDAVQGGRIAEADRNTVRQFSALKGGTNERGALRFYLNDQLSAYVDLASDDVVAEIDLAGDASPFVLVLAKGTADLQYHFDYTETIPADLHLQGDIASRFLSRARMVSPHQFPAPLHTLVFPSLACTYTFSSPVVCWVP